MATELNRLLKLICDADIEFVIVGGFAAMLHGSSILTRDLDVCAPLTDSNITKLRNTFRDFHPTHRFTPQRLSFLDNPAPGATVKNVYLQTDLGPIDVLGSITGVGGFEEVRQDTVEFELFGRKISVMSIAALVKAKEALGREKDLLAAKELRAILENNKQS